MLAPSLITPPEAYPVTLGEAKVHLRVDFDDDDQIIGAMIEAATSYLDGYTGILNRALVTQTWRAAFCEWPFTDRKLRLPLAPVASVSAVTYFDTSDVEQELVSSGNWSLLADHIGPYLHFTEAFAAPALASDREDAIHVTFVAGSAASSVPAAIKSAILLMVGDLYAGRESFTSGSASAVPTSLTVDTLLTPWRRVWA